MLQPYQMIKDLRTGVETSNTQAVLDGDLDDFMVAALAGQTRDKGSVTRTRRAKPELTDRDDRRDRAWRKLAGWHPS